MPFIEEERAATVVRRKAERRSAVPHDLLPPDIFDSWKRCVAAGLDPWRPPAVQVESIVKLREARQRHCLVRRLAMAEMNALHHQIAGSNFMIAFAAPDGMLLDVISDNTFGASAHASVIRPGTIWTEKRCGTNALGTAAILRRQVIVHRHEHFFPRFNALSCIASPVFAPDGTLAGLIDASSDCETRQAHTQALVSMAATQIENGLIREQHHADLLVAFHSRGEYLHTLSTGLVAIDRDGVIVAANAQARNLVHGLPMQPGRLFNDVFRTTFDDFVMMARKRERQGLEDNVGSTFVAMIENFRAAEVSMRVRAAPAPTPTSFVASDAFVTRLVRQVENAAAKQMPVLIRGQTGTGKEQLARHAHEASGRKGAFVPVNCAALPESLVEAELFGYADGAFTGARKGGAIGLAKEADGGTLFLDEIGDMPVALQAVLLRFLDDWTVRPVGGTRSKVNILLVSATNAKLDEAIAEGRFRSDLLYRLNTLEVTLPPLSQRRDFEIIVRHLLATIDAECEITGSAVARLGQRAWPGNIRELRNVLARYTLAATDGVIDDAVVGISNQPEEPKPTGSLREVQQARALAVHEETGGNISETARKLGVSRNTVYRLIGKKSG